MADKPERSSGAQSHLTALLARLGDTKISTWSKAAKELCEMGTAAIPVMIELLASDNEDIRGYMAWALGEMGPQAKAAIPGLLKLLDDQGATWFRDKRRNYPVRFRAAFSIAKIAPERDEIIPVLREAMHYRKLEYVRAEAYDVVGILGPRASVFIPDLKAIEKIPNPTDRVRAQLTLANLDPAYEITDELARQIKQSLKAE